MKHAGPPQPDSPRPQDPIAKLDELLEVLFWMQGEGFGEEATVERLSRFLTYAEDEVARLLARLVERGDVEAVKSTHVRYQLTAVGRREAGRRFRETFEPLLSQGHGECNDPECDCMTDGAAACRHHQHDHAGHGA
jgi:DNA-binding IclR family transcriptional regulator